MIDLQYHKGQKCIISSTFCQEGYCSACAIQMAKISNDYEVPIEKSPQTGIKKGHRNSVRQETMQPL